MMKQLGLTTVRLDLPFRLNHVNCFVGDGIDGTIVIDTGLHNRQTVKRWEHELAGKTVTDILITHYHPDHFGYAGGLQKMVNARVSMSEIDAASGLKAWGKNIITKADQHYKLAGIPEADGNEMIKNTKEFMAAVTPYPQVNHYLKEGEKLVIGKYEYEIIFTPGHSEGLITLYNKEKNVLLSTDHILPRITPNISYWFHGDPNPLHSYIQSLNKIEALDVDFVIPSHGRPFYGANDRIDEIKSHHEERLQYTLATIKKSGTVYGVCNQLFQQDLTIHEMRFAIGETVAHLEYLRAEGKCNRKTVNGKWVYFI